MKTGENKELNALIRMMIYLKHELIRNELEEEAERIEEALKSLQDKIDILSNYSSHEID